jgi:hypothetical protein
MIKAYLEILSFYELESRVSPLVGAGAEKYDPQVLDYPNSSWIQSLTKKSQRFWDLVEKPPPPLPPMMHRDGAPIFLNELRWPRHFLLCRDKHVNNARCPFFQSAAEE